MYLDYANLVFYGQEQGYEVFNRFVNTNSRHGVLGFPPGWGKESVGLFRSCGCDTIMGEINVSQVTAYLFVAQCASSNRNLGNDI